MLDWPKMRIERFFEIKRALADSPAGKSLKEIYRWSGNGFRNGQTNDEWTRLLGATAQDFTHGELMYRIAEDFCDKEKGFNPEEQETLLYGIIAHDWGEAMISKDAVGDVSAAQKTSKDEEKESVIFRKALKSLKLDAEIKNKLLNGYEQVVEGQNPKLNIAFKALEKSEYVITAMKAYRNCHRLGIKLDTLAPLVGRVLAIDLGKVIDVYAPQFPNSIGQFFKSYSNLIDQMFVFSRPWLETHQEWFGKQWNHPELAATFASKWEAFKTQGRIS